MRMDCWPETGSAARTPTYSEKNPANRPQQTQGEAREPTAKKGLLTDRRMLCRRSRLRLKPPTPPTTRRRTTIPNVVQVIILLKHMQYGPSMPVPVPVETRRGAADSERQMSGSGPCVRLVWRCTVLYIHHRSTTVVLSVCSRLDRGERRHGDDDTAKWRRALRDR